MPTLLQQFLLHIDCKIPAAASNCSDVMSIQESDAENTCPDTGSAPSSSRSLTVLRWQEVCEHVQMDLSKRPVWLPV